jgi:hypothetical protein
MIRAVHAIAIELARSNSLNPDVPHVTCAVAREIEINPPGGRGIFGVVKQLQPNAAGMPAEEGEIDSSPKFMSAHGQRNAPPNFGPFGNLCRVIM